GGVSVRPAFTGRQARVAHAGALDPRRVATETPPVKVVAGQLAAVPGGRGRGARNGDRPRARRDHVARPARPCRSSAPPCARQECRRSPRAAEHRLERYQGEVVGGTTTTTASCGHRST